LHVVAFAVFLSEVSARRDAAPAWRARWSQGGHFLSSPRSEACPCQGVACDRRPLGARGPLPACGGRLTQPRVLEASTERVKMPVMASTPHVRHTVSNKNCCSLVYSNNTAVIPCPKRVIRSRSHVCLTCTRRVLELQSCTNKLQSRTDQHN
jgi:hypothetical protein